MHPFSTPENNRKLYGFLMFSGEEKRCIGNEWANRELRFVAMPVLKVCSNMEFFLIFPVTDYLRANKTDFKISVSGQVLCCVHYDILPNY